MTIAAYSHSLGSTLRIELNPWLSPGMTDPLSKTKDKLYSTLALFRVV